MDRCRDQLSEAGIRPRLVRCSLTPGTPARRPSPAPTQAACGCPRRWPKTPAGATSGPRNAPCTWTGSRPPPAPGDVCAIPTDGTTTNSAPAPSSRCSGRSRSLPETDHDVPARPGRVRKRMAARLRRAQPAQAAPPPPGGLTVQRPIPRQLGTQDRPRRKSRTPVSAFQDPRPGLHTALRDRLKHTAWAACLLFRGRDRQPFPESPLITAR